MERLLYYHLSKIVKIVETVISTVFLKGENFNHKECGGTHQIVRDANYHGGMAYYRMIGSQLLLW